MARHQKLFAGQRLCRFREGVGLSQAALARRIGVSASYLNQIEHDQRPLSPRVLQRLCGTFGIGLDTFVQDENLGVAQDLRDALADPLFGGTTTEIAEIQSALQTTPELVRRFLLLHRAYRVQGEHLDERKPATVRPVAPYEEVRDWVQLRRNHFDRLDRAAEDLFGTANLSSATLREQLAARLQAKHGFAIASDPSLLGEGVFWRLDRREKRLILAESAAVESRIFWMAHLLGQLEQRRLLDEGDPLATSQPAANVYAPTKTFPLQDRLTKVYMIRSATGIESRAGFNSTWSPDDAGQARMAAVGWLYQLALKEGKEDAFIAGLKAARDRSPADPRPHWDLYYLQILRFEFGESFEAAVTLARADPTSPSAQFALLNSLPVRAKTAMSPIYQAAEKDDGVLPMPADQVDRVLAAFRILRSRQPDWIHAAILTAIAEELKRSNRAEAIDVFYKDAVASASDADSAASVLRLAAERGDVDGVIQLFDRHERLRGNKPLPQSNLLYSNYGGYYTMAASPADSIGRAMLARADAKAMPDVLRLLDHYLAEIRRPERYALRVRSVPLAALSAAATGRAPRFQIWTGKSIRFTTVTYPTANPYYDPAAIQVLRNAFELYKREDLVSDLIAHIAKSLDDPSDSVQTYGHLALSAIRWWQDDKDESLKELASAVAKSRNDPDLTLGLADLRAQRDEPEAALKLADSFDPLDQRTLQRREILALRLSVLLGDVARARKGAERLFGLRLEADTQIQLAAQMHQLGMHELAEAVLGRARRRAGGNAAALVALMLQYQQQGKAEVAVQVANQVLRRNPAEDQPRLTTGEGSDGARSRGRPASSPARARSSEMIGRLEEQAARTPGAFADPPEAGRLLQGGRREGQIPRRA